jgi:hypothetical protein
VRRAQQAQSVRHAVDYNLFARQTSLLIVGALARSLSS